MSQPSEAFARIQRRTAVVMIVLIVASLWPISRSASSGDWVSIILLVGLDVAMVAVWVMGERKRAAMARDEQGSSASPNGPST